MTKIKVLCRLASSIPKSALGLSLLALFALLLSVFLAPVTAASEKTLQAEGVMFSFKADDSTIINSVDASFELNGNAVVTAGSSRVSADFIIIYRRKDADITDSADSSAIEKINARGNVLIESKNLVANAEEAVYDSASGTLVLTGDPVTLRYGENDSSFVTECRTITVKNLSL